MAIPRNKQSVRGKIALPAESVYATALLLVCAFLVGGGQRADISSLVFLRPVAIVALGYALCRMEGVHLQGRGFIVAFAAAMLALNLVQLIPLPPAIWTMLPGRSVIAEIDRSAGLGQLWRPIAIVPSGAWNSFFAMLVPLAVLALGMRVRSADLVWLLYVVILLGLLSCLVGLLQINGAPDNIFYLYQVTSPGSANGLFANRNHHAVFLSCLIPMMAALASDGIASRIDVRLRRAIALTVIVFLLPMIIVTGSRAGLISLVLGLLGAAIIYFRGGGAGLRQPSKRAMLLALVGAGAIAAAAIAASVYFGRAVAVDRLLESDVVEDGRLTIWRTTIEIIGSYFPFGSGAGSFASMFKLYEPHALLMTVATAHAHNDWLEVLLVAGLPGAILLGIALAAWFVGFARWWRMRDPAGENFALVGAGLWIILLLGFASIFDYPLRVPSLSCFFCVALLWASDRQMREPG